MGHPSLRRAEVCVSDEVDRPSVIGFFSPKILIPRWLLEKLTAEELRQIVLHEAGHLRRADDWLNLVQKIALVVFPLNPALVWVERRLCFERELACDERVLRETGAPKAYAACLAALAEFRLGRRGVSLSIGALGRESELGRRVGRILRGEAGMRPVHARLVMAGAMLGLLVGAVGLARCPQVVAFSERQGVGSREQGVANGALVGVGSGFRVEAVVFHPDAPRGGMGLEPTHRDRAAMNGAPGVVTPQKLVSQRQPTLREVAAKDGPPSSGGRPLRSGGGSPISREEQPRFVRWVVVTSWDGADGSRMVLTTASVPATAARDDEQPQPLAEEQSPQPPSQVHPYAAVPVRGGWLVIQL